VTAPIEQVPPHSLPPQAVHSIMLRDHRHVLVRPVNSSDRDALATAFLRLSSESQRSRFGSAPRILGSAALRHLVDSVDGVDHVAFAAFAQHEPERLVGVARILRYPDDRESLDVGVTVADDYQGSGLGTVLASLLADHRPRPARRVITHVADGNHRAMSLLTAFGLPQRASDGRLFIDLNDSGTEHEDTSPAAATKHRGSVSRCYPRWPRSASGDTAMTGSLLVPEGEQG
jgi:RimJ/RimL family protein N-acetyltransferase